MKKINLNDNAKQQIKEVEKEIKELTEKSDNSRMRAEIMELNEKIKHKEAILKQMKG